MDEFNSYNQNMYSSYSRGPSGGGSDMLSGLKDDFSSTMRGLQNSMALSLQNLNLTLSNLSRSVQGVGSGLSNLSTAYNSKFPHMEYIPSYGNVNTQGALSDSMRDTMGSNSMTSLILGRRPYNVNPLEYSSYLPTELGHRAAMTGLNFTKNLATASLSFLGPIGMGAGMAIDAVADPVLQRADQYGRDLYGIQRMSTRFGNRFSTNESAKVASMINRYGHQELMGTSSIDTRLGTSGLRDMTMMGLQSNMFHGGQGGDDLIKQIESGAQVVKFLTQILGSKDIQETMQSVQQFKQMGVNVFKDPGFAMKMGLNSFKYSQAMGVPATQLLQQATQYGSAAYGQYGMAGYLGVAPAMQNMSYIHSLEKMGLLSASELAVGGGHSAIAGRYTQSMAGMTADQRFGGVALAAGMTSSGTFSMGALKDASAGGYQGALSAAVQNIAGKPRMYAGYVMNKHRLLDQMEQQGGVNEATKQTVFQALEYMPHSIDNPDMVGMYIMQFASQNGIPMDIPTAKAMAIEYLSPGIKNTIEGDSNRHLKRGLLNMHKMETSSIRNITRIADTFERLPSALKNLGTEAGIRIHDFTREAIIDPLTDDADDFSTPGTQSQARFTGRSASNARKLYNIYRESSPTSSLAPNKSLDTEKFQEAYAEVEKGGLGASKGRSLLTASLASASRDYYDEIFNPDRINENYALKALQDKGLISGTVSGQQIMSGFGGTDTRDLNSMVNYLNSSILDKDNMQAAIKKEQGTLQNQYRAWGMEGMGDQYITDAIGASSVSGFKNMSPAAQYAALADKFNNGANKDKFTALAKSNGGLTTNQFAAHLVAAQTGSTDLGAGSYRLLSKEDQELINAMGAGYQVKANKGLPTAQMFKMMGDAGIEFDLNSSNTMLDAFGLKGSDISSLKDLNPEDFKKAMSLLSSSAFYDSGTMGTDPRTGKNYKSAIDPEVLKTLDPKTQALITKIAGDSPEKVREALRKDPKLKRALESGNYEDFEKTLTSSVAGKLAMDDAGTTADALVNLYGIQGYSKDELSKSVINDDFINIVAKGDFKYKSGTAAKRKAQEMQEYIKSNDIAGFQKYVYDNGLASTESINTIKSSSEMAAMANNILTQDVTQQADKVADKKETAKDTYKSAIDTAVIADQGQPRVRVEVVNGEAAKNIGDAKGGTGGGSGGGKPGQGGQFTFTESTGLEGIMKSLGYNYIPKSE